MDSAPRLRERPRELTGLRGELGGLWKPSWRGDGIRRLALQSLQYLACGHIIFPVGREGQQKTLVGC